MTNQVIELAIPLPSTYLVSQQKYNNKARGYAIKQYRATVADLARCLLSKGDFPIKSKVRIHHDWYCGKNPYETAMGAKCPTKYKMYRPQDTANAIAALKAAIDGLVDAEILEDDRAKFVCWGEFNRLSTKKEHGGKHGVVLRLEVLSA